MPTISQLINTNLTQYKPAAPAATAKTTTAVQPGLGVKNYPKKRVFEVVLISIAKAFADLNVKDISETDRDYLVNELTDNIIKRYPSIRLSEIPDAIAGGIRGKYGEFYGFSVVTFERFIEQHLQSEHRQQAIRALPQPEEERRPPNPDVQFATAKGNALLALQRKKNGGDIAAMAPHVYNFLDSLQLLPFNAGEKYDMMADGTRKLIEELKFKLLVSLAHERAAIKHDIQTYQQALAGKPIGSEYYHRIIALAKKLALDAFLQGVMIEEADLGEMIEGKRGLFAG